MDNILIDEETIQKRITELADELYETYGDEKVVFICTLKGAVFFTCDLLKKYKGRAFVDFLRVSSYDGDHSTGKVSLNLSVSEENVKGQNIIIVEDIVDTGRSIDFLYDYIGKMSPKTLTTCTLLYKEEKSTVKNKPDYVGFKIDDLFVIGYGLDYNQEYRNLPYIKVLKNSK